MSLKSVRKRCKKNTRKLSKKHTRKRSRKNTRKRSRKRSRKLSRKNIDGSNIKPVKQIVDDINLYHGLSNGESINMSDNLKILHNIIDKGFLFPHADSFHNTFELKLYQAILPYLEKNETNTLISLDKKTIETKYPSLYKKLLDLEPEPRNIYENLGKKLIFEKNDSINLTFDLGLIRKLTNYFTDYYGSIYNKYITLHYLINENVIKELLTDTFGEYVLYTDGYYYIPQPIPNKFLETIIIDGEKLSGEDISKLRKTLDDKGLKHVKIEEKIITTFKDTDKLIRKFNECFSKNEFFLAESYASELVTFYSSEKNISEETHWKKKGELAYTKHIESIKKEQEEKKKLDRIRRPTITSLTRKEGGGKKGRSY